ncbi:ricin-type beta-trefoil lectin domain protein [Micromonospora sp. NPDC049171]|uniref:ricin-type beta-trefoil lectin domain protein n=1 Tax=Micromonospora sp. NPDC049171 TaxID=3155770 RepID=UPI003411E1A6
MGPRLQRRLHHPVLGALALVLTTGLWAAPATAAPAQEPGVTLRVFDVQVPLSELCTLKPAQTPNVDKLMPTINWTSATDFGFEDNFVSQVLGNITTTQAGSYTFRLSSDDGSKLAIDNTVVINHDGLHGATPPKEGTVTLTAGLHPLRIDHFERGGGQQITLEWKTPGSSSFVVVPNSALSTDAGVVRVTAPGRKECEGIADTPGDGLPLTGVHPGYTLTNLRPSGFQPKVTGMDWLADGRLVICTWGGSDQSGTSQDGEVWILGNTGGATTSGAVTTKKIAGGLKEPQGLKVVDGVVYVSEKQRLTRLVNTGGDEVAERLDTVATWPYGGNFHEFAFGLLYQDGFFYLNLSVSINSGGATTNPQPATNRGTTLKVNKDTGAVSYVAGGLRTPHGIGWGPEGGIFVTDNQGGWLPSSKLVHVKQGRFFNHYTNPAGPFDTALVTPPVLWMPQNEIANSPSTPLYLTSGRYAGQFVIGDVTYGGLQRANVEKINGEYQGALFRLTQGLEAGVSEVNIGPDGAIYVGGLGAGGNWGQTGKLSYGLQKLTPTSTTAFEMLAMRATTTGFEVEYTQPVSTETAADLAAHYKLKQWRYEATANYGGPKIDEETLSVTSATLSADGRKVSLTVAGRKAGRVVHLRSPRPFTATGGESLWSTEAWYTLNSIPGSPPAPTGGTITGVGGKCLDVDNAGTADGTKIQLYTCNGTGAQSWLRIGDTYRVLGKCLDVDNGGTANGTKVQLWTCNGTGAQVWQPQADGSIRNPQSGKVVEAAGGSTANGTQIQLGTYAGGAHQKWVIGAGVTG